jgi:predicted PurR-regulated permease PerM
MLATKYRLNRNPYFHFHPFHMLFSLIGSLVLFGLLVWILAVPAR